jgi:hypothetical protein
VLNEALAVAGKNGERFYEAELYRLKGELTLQQANQKAKGRSRKKKLSVLSSQWLCCINSHGDALPVFLRCEAQEYQGKVSSPQLAGV